MSFSAHRDGVGRLLRRLTGVSEDLLDGSTGEHARYTGMGWTMLGTAALAAVGMTILVGQLSDLPWFVAVLAGCAWGAFVLGIDFSVVSFVDSATALYKAWFTVDPERARKPTGTAAFWRTTVRVLFALVVGLAVGESLVLAAFHGAAVDHLDDREEREIRRDQCLADAQVSQFRREVQPAADCTELVGTSASSFEAAVAPPVLETAEDEVPPGGSGTSAADVERLKALDERITFYQDRAQCELYPENFSQKRINELGCSEKGGQGGAYAAAQREVANLVAEKETIQKRISDGLERDQELIQDRQADLEAEAERAAEFEEEKRNSPQAVEAAATKRQLDEQLVALRAGNGRTYGISELFDATESSVNPWIRWGLRLLFVVGDMAPVLLKVSMGTSLADQRVAIRRQIVVLDEMTHLKRAELKFQDAFALRDSAASAAQLFGDLGRAANGGASVNGKGNGNGAHGTRANHRDPVAGNPSAADDGRLAIENKMFTLLKEAGRGAYSSVWYASEGPDGFESRYPIVVKLPTPGDSHASQYLASEHERYKRFWKEPGFVDLIAGSSEALALRFYPRTSVNRWFYSRAAEGRRFSLDDVNTWIADVTFALKEPWKHNLVHGDGKPGNLVLGGSGDDETDDVLSGTEDHVLLIDLGSMVAIGERPKTITPGYIPPELFLAERMTPLCDVYSYLGGTFYFLLSGGVDPWHDQRTDLGSGSMAKDEWIALQRNAPITPLRDLNPECPAELAKLVHVWLSKEPARRLDLAGEPLNPDETGPHQAEALANRLRAQATVAFNKLRQQMGDEEMKARVFGERHPLAIAAEDAPDLTLHRSALSGSATEILS